MEIKRSQRLAKLPPYLFTELDRMKQEIVSRGKDVISLGIGDPDLPPARPVIESLKSAVEDPSVHMYPPNPGTVQLRQAVARWHERGFGVKLDPQKEVLVLVGSKEGICHLPLAMVNPGDTVLVPEPGYPPYRSGTVFAGGEVHELPLKAENGFLPDFSRVPEEVFRKTKLLFINYPNNPTGATAPQDFFETCVKLATKHGFIVAHDAAYNEVYFGSRPGTLLQCKGAKDVGVEFHSFSKTFNMCGWRVGWVAGNASVVSALAALKSNLDSGVFVPIQAAASAALDTAEKETAQMRQVYARRAKILVDGLSKAGWPVKTPPATFYVWTRIPRGTTSMGFCRTLLEEANVVVTPGHGFGPSGEGYFRISLTVSEKRLEEAVQRLSRIKCQW